MRFPYLMALVASIAVAGTFWYQSTAHLCPVPLSYRLGQLDEHFTISRDEATQKLKEAETVWEEKAGRELFQYDEEGALVVDFVFDNTQDEVNSENKALDEKNAETKALQETLVGLQKEYEEKTKTYEENVSAYEAALNQYNDRVARLNDQGGAPGAVYEDLQQERQVLDARFIELNTDADRLNAFAENINELGQKGDELVDAYNKEVDAYNREYGFAKEFTQGDYQDGKINIYTVSSDQELVTVLVHEFGHAFGVDHVADSSAVMYYLLKEEPTLTTADMEAFVAICGTGTEWEFRIRQFIRTLVD